MKTVLLNNAPGTFALVDDEDWPVVSRKEWRLDDKGYPVTNICSRIIRLHNLVFGSKNGCLVDHKSGDRLDCQKSNLRLVGSIGNAQNRKKKTAPASSKYKGCSLNKHSGTWRARIVANGTDYRLGSYATEEEAARAYDEAAIKYHGVCASLNFLRLMEDPHPEKDSP